MTPLHARHPHLDIHSESALCLPGGRRLHHCFVHANVGPLPQALLCAQLANQLRSPCCGTCLGLQIGWSGMGCRHGGRRAMARSTLCALSDTLSCHRAPVLAPTLTAAHLRPDFLQRGVLLPQPLALQLTAAQRLLATPQLALQALRRRLQPGDHSVRSGQLLASGMQGALQRGAVGCIRAGARRGGANQERRQKESAASAANLSRSAADTNASAITHTQPIHPLSRLAFHSRQGVLQLVPLPLQAGRLRRQAVGPLLIVVRSQRQRRALLLQLGQSRLCRLPCRLLLHQLSQRCGAVGTGLPCLCLGGVASRFCGIARCGIAARLAVQLLGGEGGGRD